MTHTNTANNHTTAVRTGGAFRVFTAEEAEAYFARVLQNVQRERARYEALVAEAEL